MFGARLLRKSPGFTLIATLSLALAIGANTSIFSIAKQLLFERLDVSDAASLRLLTTTAPRTTATAATIATDANFAYPVYVQLRTHNRVMDDLLAFHTTAVNATLGDRAERVAIHQVSGNYYDVLGVQPQFGRSIRPADDTAGSDAVAVISDGLWTRAFARSPAVLGQAIKLNDVPVTIVGVNPKHFTGAASTLPARAPEVIVALSKATLVTPASTGRDWLMDPSSRSVNVLGRMKPGVSEQTAQAALDTQFAASVRAIVPRHAGDAMPKLILRDGSRGLFAQQQTFATPITVLMTFLGLVLLLACANIATLMLARGARRQREISLRLALGSVGLSAAAIAIGVVVALLVMRFVKSMLFGITPSDPAVVVGATALLLLVAIGASWLPARRAARVQPIEALRRD